MDKQIQAIRRYSLLQGILLLLGAIVAANQLSTQRRISELRRSTIAYRLLTAKDSTEDPRYHTDLLAERLVRATDRWQEDLGFTGMGSVMVVAQPPKDFAQGLLGRELRGDIASTLLISYRETQYQDDLPGFTDMESMRAVISQNSRSQYLVTFDDRSTFDSVRAKDVALQIVTLETGARIIDPGEGLRFASANWARRMIEPPILGMELSISKAFLAIVVLSAASSLLLSSVSGTMNREATRSEVWVPLDSLSENRKSASYIAASIEHHVSRLFYLAAPITPMILIGMPLFVSRLRGPTWQIAVVIVIGVVSLPLVFSAVKSLSQVTRMGR